MYLFNLSYSLMHIKKNIHFQGIFGDTLPGFLFLV